MKHDFGIEDDGVKELPLRVGPTIKDADCRGRPLAGFCLMGTCLWLLGCPGDPCLVAKAQEQSMRQHIYHIGDELMSRGQLDPTRTEWRRFCPFPCNRKCS